MKKKFYAKSRFTNVPAKTKNAKVATNNLQIFTTLFRIEYEWIGAVVDDLLRYDMVPKPECEWLG